MVSSDPPKVVQLAPVDKLQAVIDEIRRALPKLAEQAELLAKIRRAHYEALMRAGFTEQQALDLCWRP